jgi:dTDP-4-dehydrorhamnose 3,5-epimerase-like enzyme
MAYFIDVPKFDDGRGSLCVVERLLPFSVKRIYYIFNVSDERGGHRHKKTIQALICLSGSCEVFVNNGRKKNTYLLDEPHKCLIVESKDWHTMDGFSKMATLLVLASEYYDANDYIDKPYK